MRLDIRIMRFPSKKPQLFRISWKNAFVTNVNIGKLVLNESKADKIS